MRATILRTLAVVACAAALGAAPAPTTAPADVGKLLIIGGGMTAAMAPTVYGLLADQLPAHGTLGYLPTAGEVVGKDIATGGRLASNLKGRKVTLIDITQTDAAKADDPELAKQIDACDGVFFGGGAQSRVVKVFHPGGKSTLISKAVDNLLARGGLVAGTSAGAELMTDPMIEMGESDKALADPSSLPIGPGMGYFKFGIVDQHFLQRGRFGRLVIALERTKQTFGFGISEARAMLVDRASGTLTTVGPDAVVFINRKDADGRKGIRVSLLGNGDTIDGRTGAITLNAAARPFGVAGHHGAPIDVANPWAKLAVGKLIDAFILADGPTSGRLLDKTQTLTLTIDDRTKAYASGTKDASLFSVVDLRLDIEAVAVDGRVAN